MKYIHSNVYYLPLYPWKIVRYTLPSSYSQRIACAPLHVSFHTYSPPCKHLRLRKSSCPLPHVDDLRESSLSSSGASIDQVREAGNMWKGSKRGKSRIRSKWTKMTMKEKKRDHSKKINVTVVYLSIRPTLLARTMRHIVQPHPFISTTRIGISTSL